MGKTLIIAELGSNAAPFSRDRIKNMVVLAKRAEADAVKVQLFKAEHFPNEERAAKKRLEFPRELYGYFLEEARKRKLQGGASVFDVDAIDLCTRLGSDFIKLATREQRNVHLREHVQRTFKGTIFRSVDFLDILEYDDRMPREVTLACISKYPTAMNHKLFLRMHETLGLVPSPWGWSSHTQGIEDCIRAAIKGASVIEKHLLYSHNDNEAKWSIDFGEFKLMARLIRSDYVQRGF